jgi:gamma-glutamyl hercynylcysteine S-oxide synthase
MWSARWRCWRHSRLKPMIMREALALDLERARSRTLSLTDLDDDELTRVHHPLMGPLVWDLAHVGQQEDLWLLRSGDLGREAVLPEEVDRLYDAFLHPRAERPTLPLLSPARSRVFIAEVRGRVLDQLEAAEELFPYAMVVQHEQQHDETMLATHQLRDGVPLLGRGRELPVGRIVVPDSVLVPAGEFVLGVDADDEPWSLDNERPSHVVDLPAFRIARLPVTNAQWLAFIDDGGYDRSIWWSDAGWQHRRDEGLERPRFWSPDGSRRRFGLVEHIPPDEPVQHVCFYEAEAFAAWSGARLPTEVEWEKACAWDPVLGRRRRWPWGDAPPTCDRANLGGEALRPAPVGAYPAGASAYGVEQLIGDVWEWTSSRFTAWPGFRPMLYSTYSEPFFGQELMVLRGGSWAVGATSIRPSFRNWDLPIRRQIFSGLRLAWDVA